MDRHEVQHGYDFSIDKIRPDELSKELSVGELAADDEWQVINYSEHYPQEDYSTPEQETDLEQSDVSAGKRMKTEDPLFDWTATDRPLEIPPDNLDPAQSTGTSIKIFVRGVGVGLTTPKI